MPDREKIKFNDVQEEMLIRQCMSDLDMINYYRIVEKDVDGGVLRYIASLDIEKLYFPNSYISTVHKHDWDTWSENPRYSFHLESAFGEPDWII